MVKIIGIASERKQFKDIMLDKVNMEMTVAEVVAIKLIVGKLTKIIRAEFINDSHGAYEEHKQLLINSIFAGKTTNYLDWLDAVRYLEERYEIKLHF